MLYNQDIDRGTERTNLENSKLQLFDCNREMFPYDIIKFQDTENDMMSCSEEEEEVVGRGDEFNGGGLC